jgi:ornithine--oxo-acid transaminase
LQRTYIRSREVASITAKNKLRHELPRDYASAGAVATRLLQVGVLTKDTHRNTIRFAPPLIIDESQVDWAADRLVEVLEEVVKANTSV